MNAFHRLHALRLDNDAARYRQAEQAPRFARIARHDAPRAITAPQLFQTPPELAARVTALVRPGSTVLEPSAGLGRLLDTLPRDCRVVAVEMAAACAGQLFAQDRNQTVIKQRDFLQVSPDELGLFDFVVTNPPFTMRSDIKHILHACSFLAPGGTLSALCMDTPHRETALRGMASSWELVPAGAFKAEGTGVPTVLLTITKP